MPRSQPQHAPDDRIRVQHMLDAAREVVSFVAGKERHDLNTNRLLERGLVNAVCEIGEAASRVSPAGRAIAPNVPWVDIVKMRNFLTHVYWKINRDYLWETVHQDIPQLIPQLERALAAWPSP